MAPRKTQTDDRAERAPEPASFADADADPAFARDVVWDRAERAQHGIRSRRAAASMLSYYLEQSGSSLSEERRRMLEKAKNELRQG